VAGIIGFVGLVVPHLARRIVGPDHRALLPLAALMGSLLLVASDTLVRVWLSDMPVGVITSIVGAPVFCYLLRRRRAAAW
jgi:ABC-type Fe3+-siderophore transport system permease subunit